MEKVKQHYENFIKVVIKNHEHLEVYLNSTVSFSDEEKQYLLDLWNNKPSEPAPVEDEEVEIGELDEMTKRELETYAREQHDVELDRRLSKTKLIKQINKIENKD